MCRGVLTSTPIRKWTQTPHQGTFFGSNWYRQKRSPRWPEEAKLFAIKKMRAQGLEPWTYGLKVRCSTNWATPSETSNGSVWRDKDHQFDQKCQGALRWNINNAIYPLLMWYLSDRCCSQAIKKCTRPNLKFRTRARRFHISLTDAKSAELTVDTVLNKNSANFLNSSTSKYLSLIELSRIWRSTLNNEITGLTRIWLRARSLP